METCILKQSVQAMLFKMSSIFVWTICLVVAHAMGDLSEASAGFSVSPTPYVLTAPVGQATIPVVVTVKNTGSYAATYWYNDNIYWLQGLSALSITLPAGASGTFSITAKITDPGTAGPPLGAGTYTGAIQIGDGSTITTIPVTLTVTPGSTTPAIGLSPTSLAFTGSVGGANPMAQTISIANTGGGTLSWSTSDNAPWLTSPRLPARAPAPPRRLDR